MGSNTRYSVDYTEGPRYLVHHVRVLRPVGDSPRRVFVFQRGL